MNDENLLKGKNTQFQTGEKQARIAREGGIASGKAKRERKAVKTAILDAIYSPSMSGGTVLDDMVSGLIAQVILKGDQNAFEKLMEYAGLSPERKRKDEELKLKKKQMDQGDSREPVKVVIDV